MSGHKSDDSMVTGKHRPWAGEPGSAVPRVSGSLRDPRVGSPLRDPRLNGAAGDPRVSSPLRDQQRNWLDRSQPANPRHAAITRSLYSWSNYKSWTDKINKSWEKDKSGK